MPEPGSAQVIGAWMEERAQVDLLFGQGLLGSRSSLLKRNLGIMVRPSFRESGGLCWGLLNVPSLSLRRCFPPCSLRLLALR